MWDLNNIIHVISEQKVILRISTWYMTAGRMTVDEKMMVLRMMVVWMVVLMAP